MDLRSIDPLQAAAVMRLDTKYNKQILCIIAPPHVENILSGNSTREPVSDPLILSLLTQHWLDQPPDSDSVWYGGK